jgi:chromosome segregation ATPase
MEPEYDPALVPEARGDGPAPLWVWLLVVVLGAIAVYSGYTALSAHQLYLEGESVRADLAQQRDRLKANVADLNRQMEQANRSRDEVENALKQSRANTEAASAQLSDLQRQMGDLQRRTTDLESARDTAAENAKQATSAKEAAEREVESLKKQLADVQKELETARTDLANARRQARPAPAAPPATP